MSLGSAPAPLSFGPRHLDFSRRNGTDPVAAGVEFVRIALAEWCIDAEPPEAEVAAGPLGAVAELAVDVVLIVAELLSNAERHGAGSRSLDLEARNGRLRVTVVDGSPLAPHPVLPHRPERTGGHGLHIIDRLSTAWGWEPQGPGKAVWAELSVPGAGLSVRGAGAGHFG